MNGAESLVRSLMTSGIGLCFANPGTSEMHFVAALDRVEGFRAILTLFEGVATGAADGYARMTGRPAATLLHLGPGLANGLANLHNARRASSPLVNIVGDHASGHLRYDAPLTSDIVGLARTVSSWVHRSHSASSVGVDAARAVQAARAAPGQIATLILPADTAWGGAERAAERLPILGPAEVSADAVTRAARSLSQGARSAMLLRGPALQREGLFAAGRIAAATGCRLFCDTFAPRIDRGAGLPVVERIPYFAEQITDFLRDMAQLVLVGARPPVTFFAYPDRPSGCLPEGCQVVYLAHEHEDGTRALAALADELHAVAPATVAALNRPDAPSGPYGVPMIAQAIGRLLPEGAIISDDSATSGAPMLAATAGAAPHTHLMLTGGAIGQGLPLAVGAAVAEPGRKTVCLTGDGSAMYTLQALWSMARERLDVTTVVFANRAYKILNIELDRVGVSSRGPQALSMLDIGHPELNWCSLARGMGVEASRASTSEAFYEQFADAMARPGPRLIEAII